MISKKRIGDGSVGIQAEHDVTVNVGLTVAEVRELTQLFLKENFPLLRQDAMEIARSYVAQLMAEFEAQFARRFQEIDTNKFRDPDVQYTLNEAVIETAKRGERANIDLLVTLILERVSKEGGDLFSLACSDAVKVVPRLTRSMIDFLTVANFFEHMFLKTFNSITDYEESAKLLYPVVKAASSVTGWQVQYLESQRCLVHLFIGRNSVYNQLKLKYPALKDTSEEQIKKDIMEKTTYFRDFVHLFEEHRMNFIRITLVGQLIAAVNYNRYLPGSNNLSELIS